MERIPNVVEVYNISPDDFVRVGFTTSQFQSTQTEYGIIKSTNLVERTAKLSLLNGEIYEVGDDGKWQSKHC